jgi:hypothetical protein
MTTTLYATPTQARTTAPASLPRYDIYQGIHKGLRAFMADTLMRVGRVDVFDAAELARTIEQLEALLNLCADHVKHENDFLHTAIQARLPAGASRTAADHVEHLHSIGALRTESRALLAAGADERMARALRLYRHLALFVAENLQHMHIEESANNAALWAHYTDAELIDIHNRLLASISPQEQLEVLRWIVPALMPVQRAGMLGAMRNEAPADFFDAVIDVVRPHLETRDWSKLASALGVQQQAGLANFA